MATLSNGRSSTPTALLDRMWTYIPQLRGYLRHRYPAVDADDLVQDVLLRLSQCAPSLSVAFPKRYLFQVASAVVVDQRRRATSRRTLLHRELTDDDHPMDELSPLRILLAREQVQTAQAVLGSLPVRTREILIAIRLECASARSVAEYHGISISAVEKHLGRAVRALSRALADTTPPYSTTDRHSSTGPSRH